MSRPIQETIQCSKCGNSQSFTVWTSVNATLDPELKHKLLSRELITFKCSNCKHESEIAYDILYHDINNKLMIWLKHENSDGSQPSIDQASMQMTEMMDGYTLRMVTSMNHLVEKIRLFDDGHNDKAIELLKLSVSAQQDESLEKELFYERSKKSLFGKKSIIFVESTDKGEMEFTVPWDDVANRIQGRLDFVKKGNQLNEEEWLQVDREYAINILTTGKTQMEQYQPTKSNSNDLKGKPDGTYQYYDEQGKMQEGWMPPEKMEELLKNSGAKKLTRVLIKGPWEGVKEDFWDVADETLAKFADDEGKVYVMCRFEKGERQHHFLSKRMWFNLEKIEQILMNPELSDEEKKQIIDQLNQDSP